MESVNVGFLWMEVFKPLGVLCMEMSRQFNVLSLSTSAVNCRFRCRALKSIRITCMSVRFGSRIGRFWVKDQENVVHVAKVVYNVVLVGQVCHVCIFGVL